MTFSFRRFLSSSISISNNSAIFSKLITFTISTPLYLPCSFPLRTLYILHTTYISIEKAYPLRVCFCTAINFSASILISFITLVKFLFKTYHNLKTFVFHLTIFSGKMSQSSLMSMWISILLLHTVLIVYIFQIIEYKHFAPTF